MDDLIYLASQSPRRSQLLTQIGVRHAVLLPSPEEDAEALELVLTDELPVDYVQRVTQLKLHAAVLRHKQRGLPVAPILCADTTVCLHGLILGKPYDATDAVHILGLLAGQTHEVLTAVCVHHQGRVFAALSRSTVSVEPLSGQQIAAYVATQEPMGKAGAYAVQGRMAMHIERIEGSYSGIMGLPLRETAGLLRAAGFPGL